MTLFDENQDPQLTRYLYALAEAVQHKHGNTVQFILDDMDNETLTKAGTVIENLSKAIWNERSRNKRKE